VRAVFLHRAEDTLGEDHELRVVGHRLGLTADSDHGADVLLGEVEDDLALGGLASGLLRGLREALLADELDRLLHVPAGLDESALAIHHPRAGALAELLDLAGGDLGHDRTSSVSVSVSAASASAGWTASAAASLGATACSGSDSGSGSGSGSG